MVVNSLTALGLIASEDTTVACTAAGRAVLGGADNTAQRTTLGLGTLATQSGTVSGTSSGSNTGDATITLTGNVTGSGVGSFAATIANDAVTYAKMQNVSATDKMLGRFSSGSGDVEEITCTAAGRALIDDADNTTQRTTLGLGTLATQSGTFSGTSSGTNTGDQTITLTGNVTGTGTGSFATTIADNAVTLAKLATQSALTVLANATNGTAVPTAVAAGSDGQIFRRSGTALAFGKVPTSQITGTATNDNATAGDIGEVILASAAEGSVSSWSTNTSKNITSISVTAGDWEISGNICWRNVAITGTATRGCISTTTGTLTALGSDGRFDSPAVPSATAAVSFSTGAIRASLSGTTTYYLVGNMVFSAGTPLAGGNLHARRVR